jgi:hypothetical protein
MSKSTRPFASLAIASLIAASSLILTACGGSDSDDQPNREASAGAMKEWEVRVGREEVKGGDLKGVEVDFVNNYRDGKDIQVGIAARACLPSGSGGCRFGDTGMKPKPLDNGFFGRWVAGNGNIVFETPAPKAYRSELIWTWSDGGQEGEARLEFSVTNPKLRKPRLTVSDGSKCLAGQIADPSEGQSQTLEDKRFNCSIKLKVTREGDTKNFKKFLVELQ